MGEDTHSPTVGLVVPVVTLEGEQRTYGTGETVTVQDDSSWKSTALKHEGNVDLTPKVDRTSRHRNEASTELTIAIQALQNAREGLNALEPRMSKHRRDAVLIDPLSQLGLAKRSANEAIRRIDAAVKRLERGGE